MAHFNIKWARSVSFSLSFSVLLINIKMKCDFKSASPFWFSPVGIHPGFDLFI